MPHAHSALISSSKANLGNGATCILINLVNLDLFSVEGHRAVVSPRLELRRTLRSTFKEVDIAKFNAFQTFLHCPSVWDTPMCIFLKFFQLRQMLTQAIVGCSFVAFTLPIDAVVPATQRYEVVMRLAYDTRIRPQMAVAFMRLYLVFVGRHHFTSYQSFIPFQWEGRHVVLRLRWKCLPTGLNSIAKPTKNVNIFFYQALV